MAQTSDKDSTFVNYYTVLTISSWITSWTSVFMPLHKYSNKYTYFWQFLSEHKKVVLLSDTIFFDVDTRFLWTSLSSDLEFVTNSKISSCEGNSNAFSFFQPLSAIEKIIMKYYIDVGTYKIIKSGSSSLVNLYSKTGGKFTVADAMNT